MKEFIGLVFAWFVVVFTIWCIVAWGVNIKHFVSALDNTHYNPNAAIIRGVGIAAFPLGVVVGFMELEGDKDSCVEKCKTEHPEFSETGCRKLCEERP